MKINVIGAGLAGCEAAFAAANMGAEVTLYEMRPEKTTPAHSTDKFAELVCSNSLKASRVDSAAGLLKEEMRRLGSVCLKSADMCSVSAGGALAVDREKFSEIITEIIKSHPNIHIEKKEITSFPKGISIVATGPLTSDAFAEFISKECDCENLSFFDAASPIVTAESVDFSKAFYASRYGKGDADYVNCPMNKEEYERFHFELVNAELAKVHEFDKPHKVYEGCMPIEVLAKRGENSIRFGPLKPVGLTDPRTLHRPWAVVQLRKENNEGTLLNLVGFQTNLKFGEQKRVFSLIPGLENAQFVRYGVMHRNTFINSPELLNENLSLKSNKNVFFAGQLSGVEGYMESAASGIVAGINAVKFALNEKPFILPEYTMTGALLKYITASTSHDFQPMGANFGILPSLDEKIKDKRERYFALAERSLKYFDNIGVII